MLKKKILEHLILDFVNFVLQTNNSLKQMGTNLRNIDANLVNKSKASNKFSIDANSTTVSFTIVSSSELKALKPSFVHCIYP